MKANGGGVVKVGQKWVDLDPRLNGRRVVEVVAVEERCVEVRSVPDGRLAHPALWRFSDNRRGFRLVEGGASE